MIRTICDVVASDYDRWYILAHSLGSVVAFNALMEPDEVLPNYLDSKRWQEIAPKAHDARIDIALQKRRPSRPAWIPPTVALSRRTLFQGFKGLLTYGSPLDKFATLWPARVPLNKEENVFRDDVEWVNVYDVTDPVGAHLDYFEPAAPGPGRIRALNLCYKASPIMLWSHVGYLRTHRNRRDELADRTVEWLVSGGPFPQPSAPSSAWLDTGKKATFARWALAYWVQLPLIAAFLFGLGLLVVHYGLTHLPWGLGSEIASLGWAGQAAMLALVALGIPLLFGAVRWLVFPPDKDDPAYKSAKVSQQLAGVVETVSSAMGARVEPGAGPTK
jgi:hypothetical protein